MTDKDFTFVITTFRSEAVIDECLKDMPKDIRKIIVENSNDHNLKNRLENMYENTECFLMPDNLGYGKANNFGIAKSTTDYIFIINPDTKITKKNLQKLYHYLKIKILQLLLHK